MWAAALFRHTPRVVGAARARALCVVPPIPAVLSPPPQVSPPRRLPSTASTTNPQPRLRPTAINSCLTEATSRGELLSVCDSHWPRFDAVNFATALNRLNRPEHRASPSSNNKPYFAFLNRMRRMLEQQGRRFADRGALARVVTELHHSRTRYKRGELVDAAVEVWLTGDAPTPGEVVDMVVAVARLKEPHPQLFSLLPGLDVGALNPAQAARLATAIVACSVADRLPGVMADLAVRCCDGLPSMAMGDVSKAAWAFSQRSPGGGLAHGDIVMVCAYEVALRLGVLAASGAVVPGQVVDVQVQVDRKAGTRTIRASVVDASVPPAERSAPVALSFSAPLAGVAAGAATYAGAMSGAATAAGAAVVASAAATAGTVAAVAAAAALLWGAAAGTQARTTCRYTTKQLVVPHAELSSVALSLARAGLPHGDSFSAMAEFVTPSLVSLRPSVLGELVLAFGMCFQHHAGQDDAVWAFLSEAAHRVPDAAGDMPPQVLANCLTGFAVAGLDDPDLYQVLAAHLGRSVGALLPQTIADVLWALAHSSTSAPDVVDALVRRLERVRGRITCDGLVHALWGAALQASYPPSLATHAKRRLPTASLPPGVASSAMTTPLFFPFVPAAGGESNLVVLGTSLSPRSVLMLHVAHCSHMHLAGGGTPVLGPHAAQVCLAEFIGFEETRLRAALAAAGTSVGAVCDVVAPLCKRLEPLMVTPTGMVVDIALHCSPGGLAVADIEPGQPAQGAALLFTHAADLQEANRGDLVHAAGWHPVWISLADWQAAPDASARRDLVRQALQAVQQ